MRILTLSLKNLNSLKGTWHIDFSHAAYQNTGIFAITGQTGAGKTTILDAICLALYGKTPRVDNISKATNEVMSRNAYDCMAGVTLEVKGKFYRCNWSQHRARKKVDGKLQDVNHSISELKCPQDDAGDILQSKASLTKNTIVDVIGMDFEQFTRAVLLAQGQFAKFLKAKSDDRANILEKITGTNIYASLSKKAFEKKRQFAQELDKLTAVLGSIQLLSADEAAALSQQLAEQNSQQSAQQSKLNELISHITWQQEVIQLNHHISQQQTELTLAKQAQTNFAPSLKRLQLATKALELDADYQKLMLNRKQQGEQKQQQQQLNQTLIEEQQQLATFTKQKTDAKTNLDISKQKLEALLPVITEVRTLDNALNNCQQRLTDNQNRQKQLYTTLTAINQSLQTNQQQLKGDQQSLEQVTSYLQTHANDANLTTDYPAFINTCSSIKDTLIANVTVQHRLTQHNQQDNQYNTQQQALEQQVSQLNQQLATAEQDQLSLITNSNTLLAQKPIEQWRNDLVQLSTQQYELNHLQQQQQQIAQQFSQLIDVHNTHQQAQQNKLACDQQIAAHQTQQTTIQRQLADKTQLLTLQQQVIKLETHITHLQAGEACPVCGSTQHPYLTDLTNGSHPHFDANNPQLDTLNQLTQQVDTLQVNLNQHTKQLAELTVESASHTSKMHTLAKQMTGIKTHMAELAQPLLKAINKIQEESKAQRNAHGNAQSGVQLAVKSSFALPFADLPFAELPFDTLSGSELLGDDGVLYQESIQESYQLTTEVQQQFTQVLSNIKDALNQLLEHNQQQHTTHANTIEEYEALLKQLEAKKTEQSQLSDSLHDAKSQLQDINGKQQLHKQQADHIKQEIQQSFALLNKQHSQLTNVLAKQQTAVPRLLDDVIKQANEINQANVTKQADSKEQTYCLTQDQADAILAELRSIAKVWKTAQTTYNSKQQLQQQLDKAISNLQSQQSSLQQQQQTAQRDYDELTRNINHQQAEQQQLASQRYSKFADKMPDIEEQQHRQTIEQQQLEFDNSKERWQKSQHNIDNLTSRLAQLSQEMEKIAGVVLEQQTSFDAQLQQHDFANLATFEQARLPQAEREQLAAQQQQLSNQVERLQALLENHQHKLADKTSTPLTDTPLEQLQQQETELRTSMDELAKHIGANQQKLHDNDNKKQQYQQQQTAIDDHKQACQVWEQLNMLIGSSDGKKFRIFAQGLTFDVMIKYANQKLQQMSDRYLLVRDTEQLLELNVIDNYQAGEIRSCKNLSGGESFIISLALALGLSTIASQHANKNMQVNSLFLDEGFGTLDEESLDIALDTLTNLQSEGKLIGVISHIRALKDRIHTQIKVDKLSGGISKLTGVGVSQGELLKT